MTHGFAAQGDPTSPLFGTPEPGICTDAGVHRRSLSGSPAMASSGSTTTLTIVWSSIQQSSGSGQKSTVGDYWWELGTSETFDGDALQETCC